MFLAELSVWFYCVQENGFLGVSENSRKNHKKSTHPKDHCARSGPRGQPGGPGTLLARPHPWPRQEAAWKGPPPSGALIHLVFIPVARKPQNRSHFPNSR